MRLRFQLAAVFFCTSAYCPAARLTTPAIQAFDAYIAHLETRLAEQHARPGTYLAVLANGASPDAAEDQLRPGSIRIEPLNGGTWRVSGGLMHHWRAAAFVPGVSAKDMVALLRDPNHLSRYYAPEIIQSRALSTGEITTSLIRFKKEKMVTVVLDAEFEGRSSLTGGNRGSSFSHSVHIWQVDDPGTPHEHRRPEGDDDGFLWRLNSYWSFLETHDGLLIECEAVSLTRGIPTGLGWLISPIIESLPRESLQFTLNATKNALMAYAMKETRDDHAN